MTAVSIIIGALTGIISGFGIGGGSLLVLYLTAVIGQEQYIAGGINLLYFIACAPMALIGHIKQRRIVWRAALWCTIAGVLTTLLVSIMIKRIDNDWMRRLFGLLLIYVGIKEWRSAGKNDR